MTRAVVAVIVLVLAAFGVAGCVRHVELTPADAAIDAPYHPDAPIDAAFDAAVPDAVPDSALDAM